MIKLESSLPGHICCQINREPIGIIELERHRAWNHPPIERPHLLIKDPKPLFQGLGKTNPFPLQDFFNFTLLLNQFRIGLSHLLGQYTNQLMKKGGGRTQLVAVANSATNNAA